MGTVIEFLAAGTTSWTVPAGVTSLTKVECIAPGGDGARNTGGGGGGGSGGYSLKNNYAVTPGASITTQVGAHGSGNATWFNSSGTVNANAGASGSGATGGNGGAAGTGDTTYAGANGGNADGSSNSSGGGGGAAGPSGAGKAGGNGDATGQGGGGGGGSNGGSSTAGANSGASGAGGNGGNGTGGTGGGAGGSAFGSGTAATANSGGGGGGGGKFGAGAAGAGSIVWTATTGGATAGPGGGGGGAGNLTAPGGAGGGYGAGGGGYGSGSMAPVGTDGIIVLTYSVPASASLTEAGNATDAQSATMNPSASLTEAASATDTISAAPNMDANVAEISSASDTTNIIAIAALTEAASAADTLQPNVSASTIEAANSADIISGALVTAAAVNEPASATDTLPQPSSIVSLIEMANAADAPTSTLSPVSISINETAHAADTVGPFSTSESIAETADAKDALDSVLYARWNYLPTVISQYRNSPILLALIDYFSQWVDQDYNVNQFFAKMWNIETAEGYGLDVWGRIVGVGRTLEVLTGTYFEFEQQAQVSDQPFGGGPFYSGTPSTTSYILADDAFRQLILAKALSNICDGSIPAINAILMFLFPGMGNCFVTDGEDMTMTYTFGATLTPVQYAIISQTGVLPRPVGVSMTIVQP